MLALYVSALLLRLLYLWEVRDNPFLDALGLDARYYDLRAREILSEGLIGDEAYFMGPLYPHFLAATYAVAGRNLDLVRILQAVLAAFVPLLLYRMGVRLLTPRVGLIAAIVAVVYGPFLFYTGTILYTTLVSVLLLWILDRLTSPPGGHPVRNRLLTGVLFGLAVVGKGNLLLFLPFAIAGLAWGAGERRRGKHRRWSLRPILPFLVGFLVVISLVTARNYAASGDIVPLTSNGGLNFYIGNGPESSGAYEKPKGLDVNSDPSGRRLLEKQLGRSLSPSEVSGEWRGRSVSWIVESPVEEARLLLRKSVLFFSDFEIPQIESYRFQMRYSRLITIFHIPFGLLVPLAFASFPFFRRRETALLLAFLFVYALSIIIIFVLTRYRLPVVPVLLLMAAHTVSEFVRDVRRKRWRGFTRRAALMVPFLVFCNVNFYNISPTTGEAQSHFRLGIIRQSEGKIDEALKEYRRSVELDPDYARSRLNLGELLAVSDNREEAEKQFRTAIRIDPDYPKAYLNLGTVLYRTDRREEGREALNRAVELDPAYGKAWLHLAVLALLEGDTTGVAMAERAVAALSGDEPARGLADEIRFKLKEVGAVGRWRETKGLPALLPGPTREAIVAELLLDRGGFLELYAEGAVDGDPSALYLYGSALYRMEDLDGAERLLDAAAEKGEDMPYLHFANGVLHHRNGRPDLALTEFLRETETNPSFTPAWKNAALLSAQSGSIENARRLAAEFVRMGGEKDRAIESILRGR